MMDTEEWQAALSLLLQDAEGELGDRHEIHERVRQTLDGMRAVGMPLPDDLVRLEQALEAEFAEEAAAPVAGPTGAEPPG
jgi:hypothetical protein